MKMGNLNLWKTILSDAYSRLDKKYRADVLLISLSIDPKYQKGHQLNMLAFQNHNNTRRLHFVFCRASDAHQ